MKEKLLKLKDFFLSRPKEEWCINMNVNHSYNKCCAAGHTLYDKKEGIYTLHWSTSTANPTYDLFEEVSIWLADVITVTPVSPMRGWGHMDNKAAYYGNNPKSFLVHVNNGCYNEYQQEGIRDRVIAAIDDGLKIWDEQHPEYKDITKELAVLPTEEVSDVKKVYAQEPAN